MKRSTRRRIKRVLFSWPVATGGAYLAGKGIGRPIREHLGKKLTKRLYKIKESPEEVAKLTGYFEKRFGKKIPVEIGELGGHGGGFLPVFDRIILEKASPEILAHELGHARHPIFTVLGRLTTLYPFEETAASIKGYKMLKEVFGPERAKQAWKLFYAPAAGTYFATALGPWAAIGTYLVHRKLKKRRQRLHSNLVRRKRISGRGLRNVKKNLSTPHLRIA